ncbi:MAG TPA: ATP phosphoribosyltransferase regulatory subunit, partial [Polyangiaceae bacterium]|nr:ATP phosphoribosyltransferase regulatory subunit [Polyangiaceae bacterium]
HGYEQVMLPMFEYGAVLERGLGALVDEELLRFIEPETGSVVVLRPDMTAQIARIMGTRLADAPGPARLSYQGNIVRRQHERARHERQIPQAGIELLGRGGIEADLEVLEVAVAAVRRAGLDDFAVDLGHAGIAAALLDELEPDARTPIVEALGIRDVPELTRRAEAQGLRGAELRALAELPTLHGSSGVWEAAERALGSTKARAGLEELRQLAEALERAELAPRLLIDLAETRDLAYYTGPVFQIHAAGPGRFIGAGGRYDGLCSRFGRSRPAAGFAFGLDELSWALAVAGRPRRRAARVLVFGGDSAVLAGLRACRVACAASAGGDPLAYARAWRYTHVVEITLTTATLVRVEDQERQALPRDARALGAAAAALLERAGSTE